MIYERSKYSKSRCEIAGLMKEIVPDTYLQKQLFQFSSAITLSSFFPWIRTPILFHRFPGIRLPPVSSFYFLHHSLQNIWTKKLHRIYFINLGISLSAFNVIFNTFQQSQSLISCLKFELFKRLTEGNEQSSVQ